MDRDEHNRREEAAYIASSGVSVREAVDWIDSLDRKDQAALPHGVVVRSIVRGYIRALGDPRHQSDYWPEGYFS